MKKLFLFATPRALTLLVNAAHAGGRCSKMDVDCQTEASYDMRESKSSALATVNVPEKQPAAPVIAAQPEAIDLYRQGKLLLKTDIAQAIELIRRSAELGYAKALTRIADYLQDGWNVIKDEKLAAELYRRAAEQEYEAAQHELGLCYLYGIGVHADEPEARKWLLRAEAQGCLDATFKLAELYST